MTSLSIEFRKSEWAENEERKNAESIILSECTQYHAFITEMEIDEMNEWQPKEENEKKNIKCNCPVCHSEINWNVHYL